MNSDDYKRISRKLAFIVKFLCSVDAAEFGSYFRGRRSEADTREPGKSN